MVMVMWMRVRADTLLGAIQAHSQEEEYPGRAGLSWQKRQVPQTLTRGRCGMWLVEWSLALESQGLSSGSKLCSLGHVLNLSPPNVT